MFGHDCGNALRTVLAKSDALTAQHVATGYPNPGKAYELFLAFGRRRTLTAEHLRRDL